MSVSVCNKSVGIPVIVSAYTDLLIQSRLFTNLTDTIFQNIRKDPSYPNLYHRDPYQTVTKDAIKVTVPIKCNIKTLHLSNFSQVLTR